MGIVDEAPRLGMKKGGIEDLAGKSLVEC